MIVPNQAVATYVTQWKYESHNRLLEMIYPDEEKVTYGYNLGGQLTHVRGYKSYGYDYVQKIGYDKFEQRSYLKYCNGAETFYSYDPQRRRLQNLAVNAKAGTIMDNAYSYDAVSNVLGIKNNAPLPQSGKAGGQMSHSYTYDPLYRLASATGTYKGTDNKSASYTLSMGYDNMHRITSKKQHLSQTGVQFDGTLNAGYELAYTYQNGDGKKFQLDNVCDINYRTEETPTDSATINNGHKYEYDANGNLVYINTSRVKKDGKEDEKASEQKYRWDEENRLLAADENGFVSNYWYDADGERTVKTSGENEAIYVNSEFSGGNTGTARFSLYVSPYLVAGQGGKYTKHIYIGSQRIVSKLGDLASYGADPRRIPYAGHEADGVTVDYKAKYSQQLQSIKDNYKTFDIPYNGEDNDDYVNGQGFCCNDGTPEAAQARAMARTRAASGNFKPNDDYEKMQFYYHPDHLGSSSYITNLDGEVSQHIEYVPFGEVFIEERNNTWNTPYLFNAKEFDEETGMYYYGARYYEPRLSLWMSTDPLQEKYPDINSYCYTYNNPINLTDPTGMDWVEGKDGDITWRKEVNANNYSSILSKDEIYRGQSYTRDKIWMDVNVKGDSESGLMTENYLPSGEMKYKNNTPWVDVAVEEMKKNISENGKNPEILKYFDYTQLKGTSAAKTDNTPWCAAFVNYCMETSDINGTNSATAYSFKQWGQSYTKSEPKFGSIAIMNYSHVGIVVGKNNDGRIILLGGNQHDAVNLSPNPVNLVVKYVYPKDYNPTKLSLPLFNMKGRSLNMNTSR